MPNSSIELQIEVGAAVPLDGVLSMPEGSHEVVIFAHGSGSSRHSPRNRYVADILNARGLGTLLFDLLTVEEEGLDAWTRELRFDIDLLADRLTACIDWMSRQPHMAGARVGLFGASTGAAGALIAASRRPSTVRAVVSRGGRPDLAGGALPRVLAPTLLIVGGADEHVIGLNSKAAHRMKVHTKIEIVPGATHLFEEPGALEQVAQLAAAWFATYMRPESRGATVPSERASAP